jgi:oxygen-independent coproporphyrinogen-3 oxidase
LLRGHDFKNEVQVAAQIFFPGEKFSFVGEISSSGFTIETFFEEKNACAVVYENEKEVSRYIFSGGNEKYLNERRILMLAVYHALQKAMPTAAPWGALTGIRPSKLAREWMNDGCLDSEIFARFTNPFCVCEEKSRLAINVAHAEKKIERRIFEKNKNAVGIYISVPFCPSRCVYCSFNTANKPANADLLTQYVNALCREICEKSARAHKMGATVSSIYIGGGTPVFLPENLLEALLYAVCDAFVDNINSAIEFTAEAGRPDALSTKKLKILRKYGVNRIAVNPQTLNDDTLAAIGRSHTAADFFNAFALARDVGFTCINTDIIAGLPNETPDDMRRNMQALAQLSPENITIHTLALKRASRMNELRRESPAHYTSGETTQNMLSVAAEYCAAMGHFPYYLYRQKNMVGLFENVGYSAPSHECLYNVGMMAEVQTILGVGAGAVSKFIYEKKITREFNAKNPEIYIERIGE